MSTLVTRPNATVANGSSTVTGAATRHAALSDDLDSSYVVSSPAVGATLGMAEPTIPAGGLIKRLAIRARLANTSGGSWSTLSVYDAGATLIGNALQRVDWSTPTTITLATVDTADALTDLTVRIDSDLTVLRFYELYADTTYVAKPTLTVDAPTGTVTDNTPLASWTPVLDSDGGAQTHYKLKAFNAAQYGAGGFDPETSANVYYSGEAAGANVERDISTVLPDASYRAYVRVAQTVGGVKHWSDWTYGAFVVDATPPDAPTIVATADSANGRNQLVLTEDDSPVTTAYLEVESSLDEITWTALRTLAGGQANTGTIYDNEAPNGVEVFYRARGVNATTGTSAWATDSVAWSSGDWWLKHPTDPTLNTLVSVVSQPSHSSEGRQGIFQPLGRTDAVVIADTPGPDSGTIVFRIETETEQDDLDALRATMTPLLLQAPLADEWWRDAWVALGNRERTRLLDTQWSTASDYAVGWTEVAKPEGDLEA